MTSPRKLTKSTQLHVAYHRSSHTRCTELQAAALGDSRYDRKLFFSFYVQHLVCYTTY